MLRVDSPAWHHLVARSSSWGWHSQRSANLFSESFLSRGFEWRHRKQHSYRQHYGSHSRCNSESRVVLGRGAVLLLGFAPRRRMRAATCVVQHYQSSSSTLRTTRTSSSSNRVGRHIGRETIGAVFMHNTARSSSWRRLLLLRRGNDDNCENPDVDATGFPGNARTWCDWVSEPNATKYPN
jgi:hypothetical protein